MPSPLRTPSYNGSCEAGHGSLKTRAHRRAAQNDRPGHWTCDDVEFARLEANAAARPRGPDGPTPDEIWQARSPIEETERSGCAASVRRYEMEFRQESGYSKNYGQAPSRGLVQRVSVRRALGAHGIYVVKRRFITLPVKRRKTANIT